MKCVSLISACAAVAIAGSALCVAYVGATRELSSHLEEVALANLKTSRLGLVSQKAVLSRDDYLPVLGR